MKKLLLAIVILIVLAGVAFFVGWLQLRLPEHTYAVVFTKSGGWDEEVTSPGAFTWRWEALVPTNLTLHEYLIVPQDTEFNYTGELPSGSLYAAVLDPRPDFGYSIAFTISFTLDPDALPELASRQRIEPDALDAWYERITTSIATRAVALVESMASTDDLALLLASVSPAIETRLIESIAPQFPEIVIHRILPKRAQLPDVDLYLVAKEQYLAVLRSRDLSRIEQMEETVRTDTRVEQHFQVLERYGELLSAHPVLLELFTMKGGNLDEILAEIESIPLPETDE
jgi:hypothetical protein